MTGTVSSAAMFGMVLTALICFIMPIVAAVLVRKKLKSDLKPLLLGITTFIVAALILERIVHSIVLIAVGALAENIWFYAIYGGLAAGIFEETGRFIVMMFFMKAALTKQNSIMYGVGHGGIEAILITGISSISNIATASIINAGGVDAILSALDENTRATTLAQLELFVTLPVGDWYLAGAERIMAFTLQLALSYIVFRAVKDEKPVFFVLAILIHAGVDCVIILVAKLVNAYASEAALLVMVAIVAFFAFKDYRNYKPAEEVVSA